MLKSLKIKNLTVFPDADLKLSDTLNIIIGENGVGKTHLLKIIYSILSVSFEASRKPSPTKAWQQTFIAEKIQGVFRPESLGRLARRKQGRERCDISLSFKESSCDIEFSFATNSKSEVTLEKVPTNWVKTAPVYIPTRELLTIFPNFVSIYEGHYLEFEETWRDLCVLLGRPLQKGRKGQKEKNIQERLKLLEEAMDGGIEFDKNGHFYLNTSSGRMEMPLVAEGLRKLGMLARLIATGAFLDKGYLFWDEPEANLNPRLIKLLAQSILNLSKDGIQVFIATHSLFFLRELKILLAQRDFKSIKPRFFGLQKEGEGVKVLQDDSVNNIGDIASLDEELMQSDRFLYHFQ